MFQAAELKQLQPAVGQPAVQTKLRNYYIPVCCVSNDMNRPHQYLTIICHKVNRKGHTNGKIISLASQCLVKSI